MSSVFPPLSKDERQRHTSPARRPASARGTYEADATPTLIGRPVVSDKDHLLALQKREEVLGPLGEPNIWTLVDPQNPSPGGRADGRCEHGCSDGRDASPRPAPTWTRTACGTSWVRDQARDGEFSRLSSGR